MKRQVVQQPPAPRRWERARGRYGQDRAAGAINVSHLTRSHLTGLKTGPASAPYNSAVQMPHEVARLHRRLRDAHLDTVMALVAAVEAKDPHTERHSVHVSCYAGCLARELHLSHRETEVVKTAAVMHDIGKIGVPDAILTKPGPLTDEEFAVIKQHPTTGAAILRSTTCLRRELPLVWHHHEWYDGSGYPEGLRGDQIPFGARILQVADSIDAMLLPRSYKKSYSLDKVISEIEHGHGTQFDPVVAEVALRWLEHDREQLIMEPRENGAACPMAELV